MTPKQIQTYEYCKKHLKFLSDIRSKLPFKAQKYGCGSRNPSIEHQLQRIHSEMTTSIYNALNESQRRVQEIIDEL